MANPLVSILIPAYNERHFGEALASACAQQGVELEIVVCDDSPGEAIGAMVAAARDPRVRYVKNPARLGFAGNFTQCFTLASGEMVKFLNDDDRLRPACVATLAAILRSNPQVRLATSKRQMINAAGAPLPDGPATMAISVVPAIMAGRDLGDFVLAHSTNLIGEPTTAMFRRADLVLEDGAIFRWGGQDYHCLADMSMWLRLMENALAYYMVVPLSEFRIHDGQEQNREGVRMRCLVERLWIVRQARRRGFLSVPAAHRMALVNLRARVVPSLGVPGLTASERSELQELLADVERDIASLR